MFKAMILLKRKDSMSFEEFQGWWLESHRPMATELPGLLKGVFNLAQDGDGEYDGVSELWFDNQTDFENAYSSETGKAVAADSMGNVSQRVRLFVTEHVVR